ncbi:MAG TPA: hypothetical protein VL503_10430 [Candidatus Omnitrophota bacterium]|jgi:hypothetical protein|nr:hypothetical protein [Candidatus Omnitrophota bacterium]
MGKRTSLGIAALLALAGLGAGWDLRAAGAAEPDTAAIEAVKLSRSEVRERAETMPIDRRLDLDKRIRLTVERVNREASDQGQAKVASRLAREFHVSPDELFAEKAEQGLSWGEMMIAHTLMAHSDNPIDFGDLAALHEEGLSWAAIAFGMQYHLEDLEEWVKAEGKVAMGLPKR